MAQVILNRARLNREALAVIEAARLTAVGAAGIVAAVGVFEGGGVDVVHFRTNGIFARS